jgi:hypothetical protein
MRRPRPHRLTGSARRLVAAAVLATSAAVYAVAAAPTAGAARPGVDLRVGLPFGLPTPTVSLPVTIPSLPTALPTLPATARPTLPPTNLPTLPVTGPSLPAILPTPPITVGPVSSPASSFSGLPQGGGIPSGGPDVLGGAPGPPAAAQPGSRGVVVASRALTQPGAPVPYGSSATTASSGLAGAAGLLVSPPSPVEALAPLAGISFGHAPYLWPLFLLLDLVAAVAVVALLRRTWSAASEAD